MRRRTSAWIAGTLGVGLTASIVWAQQAPTGGMSPRAGSGASQESEPPSVYGASGTRGARYLLRNGLDYLQYQQYERALKYLRDAEALEKQLSAAERQQLKKGIEQAQSGLRAAADAATPYALSDRSRHRTGFTPARPEAETAVAARAGSTSPADRSRMQAGRAGGSGAIAGANTGLGARAGRVAADDLPGEPIRLASAEGEVSPPAQGVTPTQAGGQGLRPGQEPAAEVPVPSAVPPVDMQSARAEIPALNAPEIPVLTAVPTSPDASAGAGTPATPPAGAQPSMPPANVAEPALPPPSVTEPALPPAGATTAQVAPDQAPAVQAPAPATTAPATIPAEAGPAPIVLETPDSAANQSVPGNATPPANSSTPEASAPPVLAPASGTAAGIDPAPTTPATGGLVPAAMQEPAANGPAAPAFGGGSPVAESAPVAAVNPAPGVEPETAPLPPLGAVATRTSEAAGPAHRESEEPATAAAALSPGPAGGSEPAAGSPPSDNELPPLPADLGRDAQTAAPSPESATTASPLTPTAENAAAMPGPESAVAAEAPAGSPASTPSPASDNALPPLPDDKPAGSQPVTAAVPAPDAGALPTGNPGQVPPAGSDPSSPAGDSTATAAPAAPAADERPILVPQPDASAVAETSHAPAATATAAAGDTAPAPSRSSGSAEANFFLPPRDTPPSSLRPEEERRVAEIKARQEREELLQIQAQGRGRPQPDNGPSREGSTSNLQSQTYDISRAPSPAEARPIKAIPVPEDWVPLAARSWSPQRKYFAAAATCHLPLYFQDAALERYGHPVEQFVGPVGRYLSYPVDDPKQSTQRNQIIQPFFSAGLMALQIAAWPYNLIMDPPWEAQYDLGYYRPGDMVPTDIYWLPLHGYGPPLRGNHY